MGLIMGVLMAFSGCVVCRRPFFYNPQRVPSIRVQGSREPVCRDCIERANVERARLGLDPLVVLPGAYDPIDEHDWGE
jgi:hypothetical protein